MSSGCVVRKNCHFALKMSDSVPALAHKNVNVFLAEIPSQGSHIVVVQRPKRRCRKRRRAGQISSEQRDTSALD